MLIRFVEALILPALIAILALFVTDDGHAASKISAVRAGQGDRIVIKGQGFGGRCATCEVLAEYGNGLRLALLIDDWNERSIAARLPDVNAGERAKIRIRMNGRDSSPVVANVRTRLQSRAVARHRSARKVGDKGELSVAVAQRPPACARPTPVFSSAKLRYRKRRFGEAEIVSTPKAPCSNCQPVRVRWYHEPTGEIDFEVIATWRMVEGVCPARKR